MATSSICAELQDGFDLSCIRNLVKKYAQEAVIINYNDIDHSVSVPSGIDGETCDYTVQLTLKPGKTGVRVKLPGSGSSIKGFTAKSKDDNSFVQYLHQVQILAAGVTAAQKCILDKLDHGSYVVAVQAGQTVEIYGLQNGLSTGDYTLDIAEGGGATLIVLQSDENAQESYLPLVYKPQTGGDAVADFDELFAAPVTP